MIKFRDYISIYYITSQKHAPNNTSCLSLLGQVLFLLSLIFKNHPGHCIVEVLAIM